MHKVMSYVVNELVVSGLANSRAFQRFAVRTNQKMENLSKFAQEKKSDIAEQLEDLTKNMQETLKNRQR